MALPLTSPIDPMLAKSVRGVPDADAVPGGYAYEPKWDGFRTIVFADDGDVELQSRNGKPMTRYFPEIVDAVKAELPARCVVDGEVVLSRGGRLDFELLGQRIHPAASRVKMLAEHAPAALVVFDLLALGDDDLTQRPFAERAAALDELGLDGPSVHVTPRTRDADVAREWFTTYEGAGLDGVVAKPLDGAYEPGKRAMLKIKHERTADVALAGYRLHKTSTDERPLIGSLLLGLFDDGGDLRFVGVSASFPAARRAELYDELQELRVGEGDEHPWGNWQQPEGSRRPGAVSRWNAGKDLSFTALRVERVLEVGYDHMEGDRFRHTAQFKRWRPDREPTSCTYAQLDEAVGYDLAELLPGAPTAAPGFTGAL
ncbi:ATP dependent DNA ligase [Beutenbergia cavernae DSM 12333]|uniref:DNA ligase (ATP) n=1 Tax=Beutenbergia cavernae (strain ATCC BAA-8 / DSM 12333 / CCUG 43141 / JCM 11478 / NBRC 16432 / NCIMB 13614 / HKI 0122) TaxID=471853 RepID=C5BX68_BEUC1|nr:ATP-dependent DNA ligase [Beutenbergia cavernae]ACQ78743.1 ATP dependent DNA ligase [Beutenbergia cavernae DSM 12333]